MRTLLAVACVILALDVTVVALDGYAPAVAPTIDEGAVWHSPSLLADDEFGIQPSPAPGQSAGPIDQVQSTDASPSPTTSEPTGSSQPAEQSDHSSDRAAPLEHTTSNATPSPTSPSAPAPSPTPAVSPLPEAEPAHGQSWSEHDEELSVEIVVPKTRFAPGEVVPFTLSLCNRTREDITWNYPEDWERPVSFGYIRETSDPDWATLRNGRQGNGGTSAESYLELPAQSCVSWSGQWRQTLGEFALDGTGGEQAFPTGELVATLTIDGSAEGRDISHPEFYVNLFIG